MKGIFGCVALGIIGLATSVTPASAQYLGTYNQNGNSGNGTISGPGGYGVDYNRTRIGNFQNSAYRDNEGNQVNCTSSRIGLFANTSCY
jgi:hypothetical protein